MNVFVHIRRYVGGRSTKQIAGGKGVGSYFG